MVYTDVIMRISSILLGTYLLKILPAKKFLKIGSLILNVKKGTHLLLNILFQRVTLWGLWNIIMALWILIMDHYYGSLLWILIMDHYYGSLLWIIIMARQPA